MYRLNVVTVSRRNRSSGGSRAAYQRSGSVTSAGKRAMGGSAVASAAYIRQAKFYDERAGRNADFSRKEGVVDTFMVAPAGVPDWVYDSEKFWNAVRRSETRKDSQEAYRFILTIDRRVWRELRGAMTREFAQHLVHEYGCVVDGANHDDWASDGLEQPHNHMLMNQRKVGPEGIYGNKIAAQRAGVNFAIRRAVAGSALHQWREKWAEIENKYLELSGSDARVDHRSLKEQGIDREPMPSYGLGKWVKEMIGGVATGHMKWVEFQHLSRGRGFDAGGDDPGFMQHDVDDWAGRAPAREPDREKRREVPDHGQEL